MDEPFNLDTTRKLNASQQWEITKGHIFASIAIAGNIYHARTGENWRRLEDLANQFIKEVEDNELHFG